MRERLAVSRESVESKAVEKCRRLGKGKEKDKDEIIFN